MSASTTTKATQSFPAAITNAFTTFQTSWEALTKSTAGSSLDSVRTAFKALKESTDKHDCARIVEPLQERFDKLDSATPEQIKAISDQINTLRAQLFPEITTPPSSLILVASSSPRLGLEENIESHVKSLLEIIVSSSDEAQRLEAKAAITKLKAIKPEIQDEVASKLITHLKKQERWIAVIYLSLTLSDARRADQKAHIASIPFEIAYSEGLYLIDAGDEDEAYRLAMALPDADKSKALVPLRDRYKALENWLAVEIIDVVLAGLAPTRPKAEAGAPATLQIMPELEVTPSMSDPIFNETFPQDGKILYIHTTADEQRAEAAAIRKKMGLLRSPEQDKLLCVEIEKMKSHGKCIAVLYLCMTFSSSGRKAQEAYLSSLPEEALNSSLLFWQNDSKKALEYALRLPGKLKINALEFLRSGCKSSLLDLYITNLSPDKISTTFPPSGEYGLAPHITLLKKLIEGRALLTDDQKKELLGTLSTHVVKTSKVLMTHLESHLLLSDVDNVLKTPRVLAVANEASQGLDIKDFETAFFTPIDVLSNEALTVALERDIALRIVDKYKDIPERSIFFLHEIGLLLQKKHWETVLFLCLMRNDIGASELKSILKAIPLDYIYKALARAIQEKTSPKAILSLAMLLPGAKRTAAIDLLKGIHEKMSTFVGHTADEIEALQKGLESMSPSAEAAKDKSEGKKEDRA